MIKRIRGLAMICFICGCVLSGQAGAATTTVMGKILDATNNTVCAGASVEVDGNGTLSNAGGYYLLENIPIYAGDHCFYVTKPGYASYRLWNPELVESGVNTINATLYIGSLVSGTITEAGTGAILSGVTIAAENESGTSWQEAYSQGNGTYQIRQPPGCCTVWAAAAGHAPSPGQRIELNDQEDYPNLDIFLQPSGDLSGVIQDYQGVPVDNAKIIIYPESGNSANQQETQSNTAGAYALAGIPVGRYSLRITPRQEKNLQIVEVSGIGIQAGVTETRNFTLQPGGIISGKVNGQNGSAVENAGINLFLDMQYPFEPLFNLQTDSTGGYSIKGASPLQSYTLMVVPPAGDTINAVAIQKGITVPEGMENIQDFTLVGGGGLQGRITDHLGNSVTCGMVVAMSAELGFGQEYDSSAGNYCLKSLPENDYLFIIKPAQGNYQQATDFLRIAPGVRENYNWQLREGGILYGYVYEGSGTTTAVNARVSARHKTDLLASIVHFEKESFTAGNGYYYISGLSEKTYQITVAPEVRETDGWAGITTEAVIIPGEEKRLDFHLTSSGTMVFGTAKDQYGNRLPGSYVYFWPPGQAGSMPQTCAITDNWGNYSLMLAPGTYTAQAYHTSMLMLGANLAIEPIQGVVVSSAPQNKHLEFIMESGGTISGVVKDQLGQKLSQAVIRVYQDTNPTPARIAISDAEGYYQVTGLHSGIYNIEAEATGYNGTPGQINASLGGETEGVDLILIAQTSIAGTVSRKGDKPVRDAIVQVPDSGPAGLQTITNDKGEFILELPADGGWPFQLKASAVGLKSRTIPGLYPGDRADFILEPLIDKNEAISYPNPCREESLSFLFWLESDATVLIRVYNQAGELVWDWEGPGTGQQYNRHTWQVSGVAPGVYLYIITARETDGNTHRFPAGKLTVIK